MMNIAAPEAPRWINGTSVIEKNPWDLPTPPCLEEALKRGTIIKKIIIRDWRN